MLDEQARATTQVMITSSLAISEEKVGGGNDQDEDVGDITTNFEN